MFFNVAFNNSREMNIEINESLIANVYVRVPIEDIAKMIHDICDDLDMVNPYDKENLQEAIDRFNYLTKVES